MRGKSVLTKVLREIVTSVIAVALIVLFFWGVKCIAQPQKASVQIPTSINVGVSMSLK